MTRILLLSDTHGNIDIINTLVKKTNTDMVIHAGDFGFYNESSWHTISSNAKFHAKIFGFEKCGM